MKTKIIKAVILIVTMVFPMVFAACSGEMDPKLRELQGHWVDVNSMDTLDINGATMRLTSNGWREKYPFILSKNDYQTSLVPPRGKDFGPLSEVAIEDDGSLTAYEQVMDAEGHRYRFVREEEKAKLVQIRDLSEDLPKQIESSDIKSFSLTFHKDRDGQYGLDDFWPNGRYSWTIDKREGYWKVDFDAAGDSYIILRLSKDMDQEWIEGLAELLNQESIAGFNGYHQRNEVDRHDWALWVSSACRVSFSPEA